MYGFHYKVPLLNQSYSEKIPSMLASVLRARFACLRYAVFGFSVSLEWGESYLGFRNLSTVRVAYCEPHHKWDQKYCS